MDNDKGTITIISREGYKNVVIPIWGQNDFQSGDRMTYGITLCHTIYQLAQNALSIVQVLHLNTMVVIMNRESAANARRTQSGIADQLEPRCQLICPTYG